MHDQWEEKFRKIKAKAGYDVNKAPNLLTFPEQVTDALVEAALGNAGRATTALDALRKRAKPDPRYNDALYAAVEYLLAIAAGTENEPPSE